MSRKISAMALTGVIGSVLSATPAVAVEEVVVTAKIREQALQDVPLSITVMNEKVLEDLGIATFDNLTRWVPSLDIRTPSGRRQSTITMRGLSPNTTVERVRSVSVFIDGIYISGSIASLPLQDLERLEVVRGPQATMFGRATYTGAIDLVTRNPKVTELTGRVDAGYSEYSVNSTGRQILNGRLDFPIMTDRLWGSVSGAIDDTESFASTPSGSTEAGGEKTSSYAAVLYAEPTEGLSVKLRYNHSEDKDDTSFVHITHPDEWIADGVQTAVVGNNTIWPDGEVMDPRAGTTECQPHYGPTDATPGSVGRGIPAACGQEMERDFLSWIFDYDLSGYTLSYHGGYFRSFLDSNNDFRPRGNVDGLGVDPFFGPGNGINPGAKSPTGYIATAEKYQSDSHQLRLVSPAEGQFRWLAGVYYFDEDNINYRVDNYVPMNSWTGSITGVSRIVDRGPEETENVAVFGQVEYDLMETLTASLELRYERDTIRQVMCPDCRTQSYADQSGSDLEESEKDVLPRVTLTWMPSPEQTYYALYSEGMRSARFNDEEPANFPGNFADYVYVRPEQLKNYEVGAKNLFLENRLQTSLALFYMDLKDQQQSAQLPDSTLSFTQNVGKSSVWGYEFEAFGRITEQVSANIGIGYADHEYDTAFVPGSSLDRRILNGRTTKGLTSVGVPSTMVTGGVAYETTVATHYDLMLRADASYRSKAYVDVANQAWIGDSTQVNALASLGTEVWTLTLFARNLFDDRTSPGTYSGTSTCTYTNPAFTTFTSALQRCSGLGVSRGREVGATISLKF